MGEWLLSVWGYFWEVLGTFGGARVTVHVVIVYAVTVFVARPGTGC